MPYYDHDKDYPFAAFITNLGKYNEGELVGEWVKFPTTAEELKEVFKRIGIGQKDDFGQPYEEWFITDYDCYVDGLYSKLGEYENLDELNYLASKLDEMSESEYAQFQAGMEMGDHCGSLQEIINLTENLDCYEVYPDIHDYDDLGRYYIEELDVMQVPEHLQNYIDYEAYGRDVALEENGTFTDQGYVRDTGDSFHEYYDGERGSIPDEYRVMTFQDDLPEEEKSEWAMDIAFDMDEFFRQNDPQYAAEHPEAHAAKEELYENLMAGRISALDEKLAALGQTQEDYLPSEIEKFKDATGYEEFLDFDPAEVKAALDDPEKSHADEMLSAAEKVASEKMTVLVVEPMKEPYVKEIDPDLHSLQAEVGGDIGATYPYSDPVALVCNDEGKLIGLDLNRGLRDENGEIYDIVAGTFLVVGLGEEDFAALSPELIQKYTEQFKTPERFMQIKPQNARKIRKTEDVQTPSVSSFGFSIFKAPSMAPSTIGKYCSGQSFNFCPTRWRSSLSSRMTSGLKYLSIGRPQIFTSCMMTGRLGIVPSFSMLARYLVSIFTFSAKSFRARFFAFRASFTSAPKVSKPGQSFTFAIQHHPYTFYIS